jgi:hypothetical protein
MLLRMWYWLTQLLVSVHPLLDYNNLSLLIPTNINIMLCIVVLSLLHDRRLGLILCPPIILCLIHILHFTTPRCMLILAICEYLRVSRQRDMLVQVELTHDSIWIMILNYQEVNYPRSTHPPAIYKNSKLN